MKPKKLFAILLTLCMLLSAMPLTVFAEDCAHEYVYDCSTNCNICGEPTRPEAACVGGELQVMLFDDNGHTLMNYCIYCDYMCDYYYDVPHEDNDGDGACDVCGYTAHEHQYDYDCSPNCNVCGGYTRPEAECVKGAPEVYSIDVYDHAANYYCVYCGSIRQSGFEPHEDNDADGACDVCGYGASADCTHEYDYDCSTDCNVCGEPTRPEADHVKGDPTYWSGIDEHLASYRCIYCNAFLDQDTFEPHEDNDADSACDACGAGDGCAHEYDYECSKYCNLCGYKLRPEAECVENAVVYAIYDNEHKIVYYCLYCNRYMGEDPYEPHEDSDGDLICDVCGGYDHPEGDHVEGEPVVLSTYSLQHKLAYYCRYCSKYMREDPWESHYDNDADGACDACGYSACAHEYAYDCSIQCTLCTQISRPEAQHVAGEPKREVYVEEYHAVYIRCIYCNTYMDAYGESHYDDDDDGTCDGCGYKGCEGHVYDHDYDVYCNLCSAGRQIKAPLNAYGISVSEDVNGLAMLFSLQAEGLQFNGTKIDYTNATVGRYKLITAGAVVSNNYETTGIIPTLDNVDDVHILDVTAVYAYDYDEATSTLYYAIRIKNIPDEHKDTMVVFTPYIILEDEDGNRFTYYPNAWYAIYNENI